MEGGARSEHFVVKRSSRDLGLYTNIRVTQIYEKCLKSIN